MRADREPGARISPTSIFTLDHVGLKGKIKRALQFGKGDGYHARCRGGGANTPSLHSCRYTRTRLYAECSLHLLGKQLRSGGLKLPRLPRSLDKLRMTGEKSRPLGRLNFGNLEIWGFGQFVNLVIWGCIIEIAFRSRYYKNCELAHRKLLKGPRFPSSR